MNCCVLSFKLSLKSEGPASASFSVTDKFAIAEFETNSCDSVFQVDRCDNGVGSLALFSLSVYCIASVSKSMVVGLRK